jgi:pimeloyl-ACP methyl ester carboxylesterase
VKANSSEFIPITRRKLLGKAGSLSVAAVAPWISVPRTDLTKSGFSEEQDQPMKTDSAAPFTIDISDSTLADIARRVRATAWPDAPPGDGWDYGVNLSYLQSLAAYWLDEYDWRAQEREINRFQHFRAEIDGELLHFVHEPGSGKSPQPLLLLHGWPYSFATFLPVIERLAHPERFGGDADDGFDVIVPSLPGYGFSERPAAPLGPRAMARRINELMTTVLGYDEFIAQGGDWGAPIASWLAFEHTPQTKAIHLNSIGMGPSGPPFWVVDPGPGPLPPAERTALGEAQTRVLFDMAYFFQQMTRPLTTAYAMTDSPVGTAAWMLDKWYAWSDRGERSFEAIFSRDQLLTEVMIYLVTGTFDTSIWIHNGFLTEESWALPPGEQIATPTGFAASRHPFAAPPPRAVMAGVYNIVHWTDLPHGGHFPMAEEPEMFVEDVRQFGRLMRKG